MQSFQSALIAAADAELERFDGRKETDPSVNDILLEYWMNGRFLENGSHAGDR
jgi:hypothetical protein